jgi:NAD(P)H-dependent flavin oxidoreductase YrpB (nitropropane dioxygenase family)
MRTPICEELGIEFPIFAFTHCRDVVVAVSKAGGFGVLGAVGFSPEQLEIELNWIDEHIGDRPYGVDIVIPNKYEGQGAGSSAEELGDMLRSLVPQEHLDFARNLLVDHGVPLADDDNEGSLQLLGWTEATATPQVDVALRHPKMTLIANALGTPPRDMIDHIHAQGRKVAALCGSPAQARKHADADVDIIIAQGGEGGGHCGEVGSIVLWPQVVAEVAPRPVLAAGGIGSGQQIAAALAMGCQGAWSGSQWLMVEEAENTPVQQQAYVDATSRDTVRSRSFTGKPCRMLRNDWTDAWEDPETPDPLGMPLQYMVSGMAVRATHRWPDQTVDVAFNPVGQVVGQFQKIEKTAAVIERWVNEYLEATGRLDALNRAAIG